jgi:SAM-dependent methyltransferase
MSTPADAARERARDTYNAAADTYDDPANSFWARFGHRTVERLHLRPADRVLDVCSGSGASALPAAQRVGPSGSVLGIDLADNLLAHARAKAHAPALAALFAEAAIAAPHIDAEANRHPIASPEAWWAAVLGSGYRGTFEQLDAAAQERVRAANFEYIRASGTTSVEANVMYAVARKE